MLISLLDRLTGVLCFILLYSIDLISSAFCCKGMLKFVDFAFCCCPVPFSPFSVKTILLFSKYVKMTL